MSNDSKKPTACDSHYSSNQPDVRLNDQSGVLLSVLACELECSRTPTRTPVCSSLPLNVLPDGKRVPCKKGLSAAQINVLGLLLSIGSAVTPYKQLALELSEKYAMHRSSDAVRRTVERLANRGFIRRKQAREGTLHGVSFCIITDRLCPYIQPPANPIRADDHANVRAEQFPDHSILKEIDRKNLSIFSKEVCNYAALLNALTEEDIAFHWPELSKSGFGSVQIRQIIQRREQVADTVDNIMQGLTFAEWELSNQCMKDSKGNIIESPVKWVFRILATQGYYPRPSGYISPTERAERDREEIIQCENDARKGRFEAESNAWAAQLTLKEREVILGPKNQRRFGPEEVTLRLYYKEHILPKLQKSAPDNQSRRE